MTDPMTSMEIEDVLSSIRRLVSEELRPNSAPPSTTAPPPRASSPPLASETGKLLLTPALRVVPKEPPVPSSAPELIPEAPFMEVPVADEENGRGAVVARIGAQVSDDWDAEIDESPRAWPQASFEPEVQEVNLETVEEAEVVDVTSAEEARLQEAWRDGAWPDEPRHESEDEAEEEVHSGLLPQPEAERVESAHETDPHMAETSAESGVLADLAEAAILAELAGEVLVEEVAAPAQAAAADVFAPQDGEDFDEEALREVVRDIIREELQGALGERITRNVRKLVRAEINRALASRELS